MLSPLTNSPPGSTEPRSSALTVVVADDNERFRAGIVRALERADDVSVLGVAVDGYGALSGARELHPDVLVVDDRMPGLSGTEVAARVAADPRMAGVRVVLLSANDDPALTMRARNAGAVACIDKARSRSEIVTAIRNAAR